MDIVTDVPDLTALARRILMALQVSGRACWRNPYTTRVIGQLPGVRSSDLTVQVRVLKRAFVPVDDSGRPQRGEVA